MKASDSIKALMKGWEGCALQTYRCPSGVLTIGYGHTGSDVRPGMRITQEKADTLFDRDVARFETALNRELREARVTLSQHQYDAVLSFAFNTGIGNLLQSTLWRMIKADPSDASIAAQFRRWVYGTVNGRKQVLPGLVKRRDREAAVYATGEYS